MEMQLSKRVDRAMRKIIVPALALFATVGPAWAGLRADGSQHSQGHATPTYQAERVAESSKKDTQDKRGAGAPESRPGYHGDTSSKHGNAKFPERPESQHGHGETPGGPQH